MGVIRTETLALRCGEDLVHVRQALRAWMVELKFSLIEQTKMVTAASELARNTLVYGGGGEAELSILMENERHGVRVRFEDHGPGIADIALALTDGYTSGVGLGLGLGGSKRLVDEFDLWSQPGQGVRVTITRWK